MTDDAAGPAASGPGVSGEALTRRMLSGAGLAGPGSGIPVYPDGKSCVQFRNDLCLVLAPAVPRPGEADATWNWSLSRDGRDDPPPLAMGTAVSSAEMRRVLRENADSARGPGGMTSLELCEAALEAGAAEAYMLTVDSPSGVGRPAGLLPDGRGFIIFDGDGIGFPDAVFHVPGRLRLQIFLPGESRAQGDFGEPDQVYSGISAKRALAIIREQSAASRPRGSASPTISGRRQPPGPAARRGGGGRGPDRGTRP